MPVMINGTIYYRTVDVCRISGISRNTLFRWIKAGTIGESEHRDWRGWRLFSETQIDLIKAKTNQTNRVMLNDSILKAPPNDQVI